MDNLEQQIEARLNELSDDELNKLAIHLKVPRANEGIQAPLGVKIRDQQRKNFIKWVKETGNIQKTAIYLGVIPSSKSSTEYDSHYIKESGSISVGGDIIVGNKNIKKQDIPKKNKERWYQNRTIQAAIIGAFTLILVSCVGWYIFYNSGETANIFAYVSKDGTILRSKNFPWSIRKTKDKEGNTLYSIEGRRGDPTALSVFPDNSIGEYSVYQSSGGMVIKFTCAEEKISNFKVEFKY